MSKVYELSEELDHDPEQVALAQALTLNPDKPYLGLKGNLGLFGSPEWWSNIRDGIIPTARLSGIIQRVYVTGQDVADAPNTFDMVTTDGRKHVEGIYVNSPQDINKFREGVSVEIVYAMDELKSSQSHGEKSYSNIVLEMSVSS
jgi:hypothetical protein